MHIFFSFNIIFNIVLDATVLYIRLDLYECTVKLIWNHDNSGGIFHLSLAFYLAVKISQMIATFKTVCA